MNKWLGMGRLTRDVEVRYGGTDNTAVARFTLAVDRQYKKDGNAEADFISCVAFGKAAEFLEKYGHKGTKFVIEGRIQTGSYEKDGNKVYTTDVVVERMEFAESKASNTETTPTPANNQWMNIPEGIDEELPFN